MQIQWMEDNDGNPYPVMYDDYLGQNVRVYPVRDEDGYAPAASYERRRGEDYEDPPPRINVTRGGKTVSAYANLGWPDGTAAANPAHVMPGDVISMADAGAMYGHAPGTPWTVGGSPDSKLGLAQFMGSRGLTPQQYQAQYGGLPFVFNADGTATFDPAAQKNKFSYEGTPSWQEKVFPAAILALAGAGLGGFLPGTASIFGGAGAAGAGAGAGMAEGLSALAVEAAPSSTLAGLGNFSLATPGAGIGGVGSAGLGLSGGAGGLIGSTAGQLAAAGGVGLPALPAALAGTGAGLGLAMTGGNAIMNTAAGLASGVGGLAPPVGAAAGAGTAAGLTIPTTAAAGGGAMTAAGTLSELLKKAGIDVNPGTLDLIGKGLGIGLGMYGSNQQANASQDLANQYMNMGAPYRAELANLNANPGQFYQSPMVQGALQQGSDALSRSLSAKVGNPILNPTALQEMQNYTTRGLLDAYNQRFSQLASAGQLGTSQAAPLGSNAIQQQGNTYNALGAGIQSVFGNQRDYAGELLDAMKGRNIGGVSLA
jgi:hypothetical protein